MDLSSFITILRSLQQTGQEAKDMIAKLPKKKQGAMIQMLKEEIVPMRAVTKTYMKSVFETDRDLCKAIKVAKKQVRANFNFPVMGLVQLSPGGSLTAKQEAVDHCTKLSMFHCSWRLWIRP